MKSIQEPVQPKAFPNWILVVWLLALLAVPIVLWTLPADQFDEGESLCPSVQLFNTECPGCGSTRAIQHLHHAEISDALYFHKLSPLIYLALVYFWLRWTYQTAARLGILGEKLKEKVTSQLRESLAENMRKKAERKANSS